MKAWHCNLTDLFATEGFNFKMDFLKNLDKLKFDKNFNFGLFYFILLFGNYSCCVRILYYFSIHCPVQSWWWVTSDHDNYETIFIINFLVWMYLAEQLSLVIAWFSRVSASLFPLLTLNHWFSLPKITKLSKQTTHYI